VKKHFDEFVEGFIKAAKETPREFFAPLIVIGRLLRRITISIIKAISK